MPIRRAMLFAAGLGTRLRPVTNQLPKALVQVGGRPLLDYNLAHFLAFGCERVVVNTHYLAPQIETHLDVLKASSPAAAAALHICHEPTLLETGGGLLNALPCLGESAFFSANSDAFWIDGATSALARMNAAWDPERMDALLLLVPHAQTVGYAGKGDFDLVEARAARGERAEAGILSRSPAAPYVFTGLQILQPRLLAGRPAGPFSLREVYAAAQQADGRLLRMYGLVHDGPWIHVGTPEELLAANAYVTTRASSSAPGPTGPAH